MLLRHRGEVMSRTVLTELVWDMNFDGDSNVVEVAIRRLRSKRRAVPDQTASRFEGWATSSKLDRGTTRDA